MTNSMFIKKFTSLLWSFQRLKSNITKCTVPNNSFPDQLTFIEVLWRIHIFLFIVVFASMLTLWLRRREIQF